jgi:spore germination protein GerM
MSFGPNLPELAVRELLLGPTPADIRAGDMTAIPSQTRLISLDVTGTVAAVDLSSEFASSGGSDQILSVAQIVMTLTGTPQITSVRFDIQGREVEAPDGRGSLSNAPRTAADYRNLIRSH